MATASAVAMPQAMDLRMFALGSEQHQVLGAVVGSVVVDVVDDFAFGEWPTQHFLHNHDVLGDSSAKTCSRMVWPVEKRVATLSNGSLRAKASFADLLSGFFRVIPSKEGIGRPPLSLAQLCSSLDGHRFALPGFRQLPAVFLAFGLAFVRSADATASFGRLRASWQALPVLNRVIGQCAVTTRPHVTGVAETALCGGFGGAPKTQVATSVLLTDMVAHAATGGQ